jgi:hypothetical protein
METLRLAQLPFVARLAIALALFDTWVIFEEGVVDRTGLWEHMPGYVRAQLCPWDLAALGILVVPLVLWRTRKAA